MAETDRTVEERLDRIEKTLDKIAQGLGQAPALLSIATDSIDEIIQDSETSEVKVDDRIKSGLSLLVRLSDPKINESINGLLDLLEQGPGLASMVVDSVDETIDQCNQGMVRLDDRLKSVNHLLTVISDPEMITKIDGLIEFSNQMPGLAAMTIDSIDEFFNTYGSEFADTMAFLQKENLLFLKNAGDALIEAQSEPPSKVGGIFGLLRTLKDPDRQRALGFFMNVLKNLGKKL